MRVNFDGGRKGFWTFVRRRMKGKYICFFEE